METWKKVAIVAGILILIASAGHEIGAWIYQLKLGLEGLSQGAQGG